MSKDLWATLTATGEIPGYGPVPAPAARAMAADRAWVRRSGRTITVNLGSGG